MTPEQMAAWSGGEWSATPTFPIVFATQDSRKVRLGALYVALPGTRADGHDFVGAAFRAGATAALVRRDWTPPADLARLPLLRADDPAAALRALAKGFRANHKAHILGVTGSNGKTTVKELLAAMLSGTGETAATPENRNNDIGLPLSLLSIPESARFGVIEAGISHPGDMDPLADMLRPDGAVVSCIGPAHIAFFGTERAIAAEKAKLLAAVRPKGFAVLSRETREFETLRAACRCRVVTCSLEGPADYAGDALDKGRLRVRHGDESAVLLETGLCGEHNLSNALLAYAAARESGASPKQILAGLATFQPPAMRWEHVDLGWMRAINDAYNANPLSMQAAFQTFADEPAPGEKVVCVGDMLELGDEAQSAEYHRAVGRAAGNGPWRLLAAVGPAAKALLEGAVEAGYPRACTAWFATTEDALAGLPLLLAPGDTLLIKGSRGMGLERLLPALRK